VRAARLSQRIAGCSGADGEITMNLIMKVGTVFALPAILSLLAAVSLAMASATPSYSKDVIRAICPNGYALLGEICVSQVSGDIVLPTRKKAGVSTQTITAR